MSPTVLVVDDDSDFRALVRLRLEALGLRVVEAETGRDALLSVTPDEVPDLIIADLWMPGIDGREVRDHLSFTHPEVPVCVWSSLPRTGPDVEAKGLESLSRIVARHCGTGTP
ncbi:response regulator [Nocardioides bruguierae]|uniref:Response regulator n=1 Tax=Nocardioides bruguierae TaxID=2945102 RepID=A0A9X2DB63_9ACTN|nr:response regulator [Nocardioides bruguierae]MCL8026090.1 response regulator [Nocardioides bruguierae]MCM0622475.1 response regulator [Nocardioides bruguierae]